ncbi:MAG: CoA-binding protein [Gammaproteobacteria bacterium]|mgnify:CR=1 FL=1|nr:MAG: CoA-binding protein [Gammaproteobacteria bacterium]
MTDKQTVVILGASDNPERYSHRAQLLLQDHGHEVILVSPKVKEVNGTLVLPNLGPIKEHVHTLTMYVSAKISSNMIEEIVALSPERVIFNPGTENPELENALNDNGIDFEEACTLVLLNTGQF